MKFSSFALVVIWRPRLSTAKFTIEASFFLEMPKLSSRLRYQCRIDCQDRNRYQLLISYQEDDCYRGSCCQKSSCCHRCSICHQGHDRTFFEPTFVIEVKIFIEAAIIIEAAFLLKVALTMKTELCSRTHFYRSRVCLRRGVINAEHALDIEVRKIGSRMERRWT